MDKKEVIIFCFVGLFEDIENVQSKFQIKFQERERESFEREL